MFAIFFSRAIIHEVQVIFQISGQNSATLLHIYSKIATIFWYANQGQAASFYTEDMAWVWSLETLFMVIKQKHKEIQQKRDALLLINLFEPKVYTRLSWKAHAACCRYAKSRKITSVENSFANFLPENKP